MNKKSNIVADPLAKPRNNINQADKLIISALSKRFSAVEEVGKIKKQMNLPIYNAVREQAVIENAQKLAKPPLNSSNVEAIYKEIINQAKINEGLQGNFLSDQNLIWNKILEKIEEYNNISLFYHSHPDFDALGSCFGLKEFINTKFPKKQVFIIRANSLKEAETKGIFPAEKEKPSKFLANSLGIVLDTGNSERIAAQDEYKKCKELIKIDHHPDIEKYAPLQWVDHSYSSCCEMLADFMFNIGKQYITDNCAKYLYAGILTDTNRFYFDNVNSRTFNIAAKLLNFDTKRMEVQEILYSNELKYVRFFHEVFNLAKFIKNDQIAYVKLPKGIHKKYDVDENTPCVHVLAHIKEVKIWVVIYYESKMKVWKGSLRSHDIDISTIAKKFDGGGHEKASGFKLKNIKDFNKMLTELEVLL